MHLVNCHLTGSGNYAMPCIFTIINQYIYSIAVLNYKYEVLKSFLFMSLFFYISNGNIAILYIILWQSQGLHSLQITLSILYFPDDYFYSSNKVFLQSSLSVLFYKYSSNNPPPYCLLEDTVEESLSRKRRLWHIDNRHTRNYIYLLLINTHFVVNIELLSMSPCY